MIFLKWHTILFKFYLCILFRAWHYFFSYFLAVCKYNWNQTTLFNVKHSVIRRFSSLFHLNQYSVCGIFNFRCWSRRTMWHIVCTLETIIHTKWHKGMFRDWSLTSNKMNVWMLEWFFYSFILLQFLLGDFDYRKYCGWKRMFRIFFANNYE